MKKALLLFFLGITGMVVSPTMAADTVPDAWLIKYFGSPTLYAAGDDPDEDGLTNLQEYQFDETNMNPANWDTDGDGLDDYYEMKYTVSGITSCSPVVFDNVALDYDGDGLSGLQEYCGVDGYPRYKQKSSSSQANTTNMLVVGMTAGGTDDLNPLNVDTDNDLLIDSFEAAWYDPDNGIDPYSAADNNESTMSIAQADSDLDGLSNFREQCLLSEFREGAGTGNAWLWDDVYPFHFSTYTVTLETTETIYIRLMTSVGANLDLGLNMSLPIPSVRSQLRDQEWTDPTEGTGYIYVDETIPPGHDTDEDLLPDGWEVDFGLDPRDDGYVYSGSASWDNGPYGDPDNDGIMNFEEYIGQDGNRFTTHPYINGTGDETNPNTHNWRPDSTYLWRWFSEYLLYVDDGDPRDGTQLNRLQTLGGALPTLSIGADSGLDSDDDGFNDYDEIQSSIGDAASSPVYSSDPYIQRSVLITNASGILLFDPEHDGSTNMMPAGVRPDLQRRDWTVECMVKLMNTNLTGNLFYFETALGPKSRLVYSLQLSNNIPVLRSSNTGGQLYQLAANRLPTNQWIHLAGSWDHGNNSLNLYIGGALAVQQKVAGECASILMHPATNDLRLAASPDGSFVNELYLDEVRIWGIARPVAAIDAYAHKLVPQDAGDDVWISSDGKSFYYRNKDTVLVHGGSLFDGEPGVALANVYNYLSNYWIDNGDGVYKQLDDTLIMHVFGTLTEGQAGSAVSSVYYNDKDQSGGFTHQSLLAYYRFDDGGNSIEDFARKAKNSLKNVTSENYRFGDFGYALDKNAVSLEMTNIPPIRSAAAYGADDSDLDGMSDAWEMVNHLDPYDNGTAGETSEGALDGPYGAKGDPDGDGLENLYEYWSHTNPQEKDSDGNSITDDQEDFDGDTVVNVIEQGLTSRPDNIDTDDDSLSDPEEVGLGSSPASAEDPAISRCMQFGGGADSYIDVPQAFRYRLNSWSIEAMVNPSQVVDDAVVMRRVVQQLADGTDAMNYIVGVTNVAGSLQVYAGYVMNDGKRYIQTGGSVPLNTWTHLAATYDSGKAALMIYINGTLAASNTTFSAAPPENGLGGEVYVRIGERFQGRLDEVRLWSDGLTADEVYQNWQLTVEPTLDELVCYFRFDDKQAVTNGTPAYPYGPYHQPHGTQDYKYLTDWNEQWIHAGTLHGDVAFHDGGAVVAPALLYVYLDAESGTEPDLWDAVSEDAGWKVTEEHGDWLTSGKSTSVDVGGSFNVTFKEIDGWEVPVDVTLTVTNGNTISMTNFYRYVGTSTSGVRCVSGTLINSSDWENRYAPPGDASGYGQFVVGVWNANSEVIGTPFTNQTRLLRVLTTNLPVAVDFGLGPLTELPTYGYYQILAWIDGDNDLKYDIGEPASSVTTIDYLTLPTGVDGLNLEITDDTDGDGLPDWYEVYSFGSLAQSAGADYDLDGLSNLQEYSIPQSITNITLLDAGHFDTDGDGMDDSWEYERYADGAGLNPSVPDAWTDMDGDGLYNVQEYLGVDGLPRIKQDVAAAVGKAVAEAISSDDLDPRNYDTDGDGLVDSFEFSWYDGVNIDPNAGTGVNIAADLDADGMTTYREQCMLAVFSEGGSNDLWSWGTNGMPSVDLTGMRAFSPPLSLGVSNIVAITNIQAILKRQGWTSPVDYDTDADALPDGWEAEYNLSPIDATGVNGYWGDPDGDTLINYQEYRGQDETRATNNPYINGSGDETNPNEYNWSLHSTCGGTGIARPAITNSYWFNYSYAPVNGTWGAAKPSVSLGAHRGTDTDDDGINDNVEIRQEYYNSGTIGSSPVHSMSPFIKRAAFITNGLGIKIPDPEGSTKGFSPHLHGESWTVECYVKCMNTNLTGYLVNNPGPLSTNQITYRLELSNNAPRISFHTIGGYRYAVEGPALPTNRWIYLAGVWDPSRNSLDLYVDGVFVQEQRIYEGALSGYLFGSVTNVTLAQSDDQSFADQLYMDEVRIWTKALTADEVEAGRRNLVSQTNSALKACYRFDDGGTSAENFAAKAKNTGVGAERSDYYYGDMGYALTENFSMVTSTVAPVLGADWRGADDSDGDGMPDAWEMINHLDPFSADGINGADGDPDSDDLKNGYEYWSGTNPWREDTNQDGVLDKAEDRDGDTVVNLIEQDLGSRPDLMDTDDDGLTDDVERNTGTSPANPVDPPINRALILGGSADDYLTVPSASDQRLLAWTVEGWVKPDSVAGGSGSILRRAVQKIGTSDYACNYELGIATNNGVLTAYAGYRLLDGTTYKLLGGTIPALNWTHLAASYDSATAALNLYVNGSLIATTNNLNNAPPINGRGGDTFMRIGENIQGKVDDVRVWSVARTPSQIVGVMNEAIDGETAGLVNYIRMDDGQAVTNRYPFNAYHQPYGAQDFTYSKDWNRQWLNAALPHGSVAMEPVTDSQIQIPPTIQVTILPSDVVDAGAQWSLNGGDWQNSAQILTSVAGTHTVSFKPVTGWVAPIDLTIIASNNMSYSTNVTYQKGGAV
ncbi:MAG: hypothetical protein EOL87_14560, partial [Spartobacteria bacterium]|nr:hypothetical protein [Spartobacteria bacterium]